MKQSRLSSPQQVLSAQSAKVITWLMVPIFFNYCALWLNLRIPHLIERAIFSQTFWIILAGGLLGGMELITRRQEFFGALPISRHALFINRLGYGLLLIFMVSILNYTIDSGLAENALYGENMMIAKPWSFTLTNSAILTLSFISSFSLCLVARTLTGVILGLLGTAAFFLPLAFLDEIHFNGWLITFAAITGVLFFSAWFDHLRTSKVKTALFSLTHLNLTAKVYWGALSALILLTITQA